MPRKQNSVFFTVQSDKYSCCPHFPQPASPRPTGRLRSLQMPALYKYSQSGVCVKVRVRVFTCVGGVFFHTNGGKLVTVPLALDFFHFIQSWGLSPQHTELPWFSERLHHKDAEFRCLVRSRVWVPSKKGGPAVGRTNDGRGTRKEPQRRHGQDREARPQA